MSTISLCMIVKDEERFLRQCLESVKDLVDEMIIVDTGSKDKTVEIAKEFGAKVFHFKWTKDFSAARNFSIKKATKDWILVLDADETLSAMDHEKVKELEKMKEFDGFFFTARNYANFQQSFNWEKHNDPYPESKKYEMWYPAEQIRMFKNHKGHKFKNKVNEVVDIPKGKLAITHIPIHHFAWERFGSRRALRRALVKKKSLDLLKGNPDDMNASYELARIHIQEGNFPAAEEVLKKAIQIYDKAKTEKKNTVKGWLFYESLAQVYLITKRNKQAVDLLNDYIKDDPNSPSTNALLAHCLVMEENYTESTEHFRKALHLWKKSPLMLISLDTFFNSYGIALLNTGKLKEAAHAFGEAFRVNPSNASAYNNLGVVFLRMKNLKNASIVFKKAVELNHPRKDEILSVIDKIESKLNKNN